MVNKGITSLIQKVLNNKNNNNNNKAILKTALTTLLAVKKHEQFIPEYQLFWLLKKADENTSCIDFSFIFSFLSTSS